MDKTTINELVLFLRETLINNGINVKSIALFGSALAGKMNNDSDIDIIIISSDFKNKDIFERAKITMKPETETLRKFKIPMDVINMTPEEYNDSKLRMFYQSKIIA